MHIVSCCFFLNMFCVVLQSMLEQVEGPVSTDEYVEVKKALAMSQSKIQILAHDNHDLEKRIQIMQSTVRPHSILSFIIVFFLYFFFMYHICFISFLKYFYLNLFFLVLCFVLFFTLLKYSSCFLACKFITTQQLSVF